MTTAIIVAAGKSVRMGGEIPKPFIRLFNRPVLAYSIAAFAKSGSVDALVVVTQPTFFDEAREVAAKYAPGLSCQVVAGGATRLASVRCGIEACPIATDVVLVHDAARPCIRAQLISELAATAKATGSAVAASKAVDTIKFASPDGIASGTIDRSRVWSVQTPQAFRFSLLHSAIEPLSDDDASITDESSAVEKLGHEVRLVHSPYPNPKLTVKEDLETAALLLRDSIKEEK